MSDTRLGAQFIDGGSAVVFRVRAPSATRLDLWTYAQAADGAPVVVQEMDGPTEGVFTATVATSALRSAPDAPIFYGYRAFGPNWPFDAAWSPGSEAGFIADVDAGGHRYNPNKLLLDPYAREVSHCVQTPQHPDRSGYLSGPLHRAIDSAPFAPKAIVVADPSVALGPRPTRHLKDDIIYEVHVRGFTKTDPSVPPELRGTYAGAALKVAYLKDLGVTAVEFQPVCQAQNALNDDAALAMDHNYWGYQTMAFFAPDRRHAADPSPGGPTREWVAMVQAFHDAGIKVFIDVVFNHHEEGDVWDAAGATAAIYSLRGLDNTGYYEVTLSEGQPQYYYNSNGVGPNLNAASDIGRDLVIDALHYWSDVLGVDGFRFDLCAVLGNKLPSGGYEFDTSDPQNILNRALTSLRERPIEGGAGVDLIAEPYIGRGDGGWELGQFPRGWAEWNTAFRDTIRASQNKLGQRTQTPADFIRRFSGSDDLFGARGRKPWASINFATCHDGFCLRDLHSYDDRRNCQPYPYGPSDGGNDKDGEMCWDHGGDVVQQLQATRTSLALVMLATGVPMITGGSEIHRTQFGNDNAYNIDTKANWLDWTLRDTYADLHAFTGALMRFRGAHPALRRADFFSGQPQGASAIKDVTWLRADGGEMDAGYMENPDNHFVAWQIDGAPAGDPAARLYVAYNGWGDPVTATLPRLDGGAWRLAIDTSDRATAWARAHGTDAAPAIDGTTVSVDGRSLVVAIA